MRKPLIFTILFMKNTALIFPSIFSPIQAISAFFIDPAAIFHFKARGFASQACTWFALLQSMFPVSTMFHYSNFYLRIHWILLEISLLISFLFDQHDNKR